MIIHITNNFIVYINPNHFLCIPSTPQLMALQNMESTKKSISTSSGDGFLTYHTNFTYDSNSLISRGFLK